MLHPSRSLASTVAASFAQWPVLLAALVFGLLECLALARCRWQDRRALRRPRD